MKEIRIPLQGVGGDAGPPLRAALRELHPGPGRIVFEPGRHAFHPETAEQVWLNAANHDNARVPVACALRGFHGLELHGEGAEWVLHGRMSAIVATDCSGLRLSGLDLRSATPYVVEGEVLENSGDAVVVRADPPHACVVRDGYAVFRDDAFAGLRTYLQLQNFNPDTHLLPDDAPDNLGSFFPNHAEAVDGQTVRLFVARKDIRPGWRMALKTERRWTPAVALDQCGDTRITDCAIRDAGGMGIIAQLCADLELRRVEVAPPPGSGRRISVQDDAGHFVHCRGKLVLENCAFERQWDDGANVHGIFRKYLVRLSPKECLVANTHFQQMGLETFYPGDRVTVRRADTLRPVLESRVATVFTINPQMTRLGVRDPLPECDGELVLGNETRHPEVAITGCRFADSIPRGVLIQTNRPSRIRHCLFRNLPGQVVATPAEAHFWYEGAGGTDLRIADNTVENCGYNPNFLGGADLLDFRVHTRGQDPDFSYHRNIVVENNRF